jgi:hypothetical protein
MTEEEAPSLDTDQLTDAMLLAADRAWRRELGGLYAGAHEARARAIRSIWLAIQTEATKTPVG